MSRPKSGEGSTVLADALPEVIARAEGIPSLPLVAREILRLSADPKASLDDFADAICTDPALATKLLRLSNSSLFGLSQRVTTISQATVVLGLETVKMMSLGFSMVDGLSQSETSKRFPHRGYWRRSLCAAVAAHELARLAKAPNAEEAFLCGLLSHLGSLVMACCLPRRYDRVLRESRGWPSDAIERKLLGFDASDVAGGLRTPTGPDDGKRLIAAADEALYRAKERGGGLCEIARGEA